MIQFTEFLVAGCDKKLICNEDNIRKEFEFLDDDNSGIIGTEEIIKFMNGMTDVSRVDP